MVEFAASSLSGHIRFKRPVAHQVVDLISKSGGLFLSSTDDEPLRVRALQGNEEVLYWSVVREKDAQGQSQAQGQQQKKCVQQPSKAVKRQQKRLQERQRKLKALEFKNKKKGVKTAEKKLVVSESDMQSGGKKRSLVEEDQDMAQSLPGSGGKRVILSATTKASHKKNKRVKMDPLLDSLLESFSVSS